MTEPTPFRHTHKRVIISFILALLAFFGIVVLVIIFHERDMLEEAYKNARGELELMGTFVREAILRGDYATVEQFLIQWGQEHAEIIDLRAVAPNNFVLAHYRRPVPAKRLYRFEQKVQYAGRDLVTLQMVRDLSSVERSLNKFILQLIIGSIVLTALLGVTLWHTLKRLALLPMEREIAIRREAEKKFRTILESAPDAMVVARREGAIALVNERTERLFGYSREELQGMDMVVLLPERFRGILKEGREACFFRPGSQPPGACIELYGLTKDGREFPIDISLSPIETDEGVFTMADIRDITERKEAEEKIKRGYYFQSTISSILQISLEPITLEEQLGRILDVILSIPFLSLQSSGCIFLVEDDPQMLVMKVQRGISEATKAACTNVPLGTCLCGLAAATRRIILADCRDRQHEVRYEGMTLHGNYCVPIISGEKVLGAINLFVTEGYIPNAEDEDLLFSVANTLAGIIVRRKAEQEKQRLQEQLIQAEKLSALGRITANVAHEIRNPLTAVGGYARRLYKKIPGGTAEKEDAEIILSQVNRLEKILKSVLMYSRESRPRVELQNVAALIDESLRVYEATCRERSVEITKSFGDMPPTMVDGDQLKVALGNLVSNAIDAMPHGGTLTIAAGREIVDGAPYLAINVRDTGEGIPEEKMKMIFEPFFTTKVLEQGTGLGLSICKKIVEDHGGFIKVESTVGRGSTFSLYFPIRDKA